MFNFTLFFQQYFMNEEARRQAEQEEQLQHEERNLLKEAEERERRKTEDEQVRLKRRIARGNYNLLMEHKMGVKLELTEEQLDQFDADKILEKKAMEVRKKRKETAEKAKILARKLDYYTRAMRLEEIPLLQAAVKPAADHAREMHERCVRELEEHSKAEHARQLKDRNRLIRMKSDVQLITNKLKEARDARYKARLAEWEENCNKTRAQRLLELKVKREAQAAAEAERKAQEEEQARREAEAEAELERAKQEKRAKESALREAARAEEERAQEAKQVEIGIRNGPDRPAEIPHRPPGFRSPMFDSNKSKYSATVSTDDWVRKPKSVIQAAPVAPPFDSPRRAPVDFGSRGAVTGVSGWSRNPQKFPNPDSGVPSQDDSGGGWTDVGSKKDPEHQTSSGHPFSRPGGGRGRPYKPPGLQRASGNVTGGRNAW
ncbi:hypothetical protein AHF37_08123 [Paragonimus kellicotti]|nr:hypothetical protein AHF37_08123 [Paragonimus kellicotti]